MLIVHWLTVLSGFGGNGLVAGEGCALDVTLEDIPVGCGLWWDGDARAVAVDELAGRGLVLDSSEPAGTFRRATDLCGYLAALRS